MLIGALAASGEANAARRDQAQAARPASGAVRHAAAAQHRTQATPRHANGRHLASASRPHTPYRRGRPHASNGGISCVPYARAVSGIQVSGNGGDWWDNASGLYDRGQRPEPGSVMAFRSSNGMSRGHVAVVRQVVGPREVLIDHANWGGPGIRRGSVMQNVSVVDVSDRNDWTAVRVQVGYDANTFGRTYATYGFIYNRPDDGVNTGTAYAGMPLRRSAQYEQVAEMPDAGTPRRFEIQGLARLGTAQAASLPASRR